MIHCCTSKTKVTLLLSLSLLFALSCEQDEQSFNSLLASVQVSAGFISPFESQSIYVIASDSNGEVIEYLKLENDQTFELTSISYTESTFTLSFIKTEQHITGKQQKHLIGKSFHGLKRGTKLFLKKQLPGYGNVGFFNFTAQNFDANQAFEYTLSSNGDIAHVTNPNSQGNPNYNGEGVLYSKNPSKVFILKYGADQKPLGYLFPSTSYTVSQKYEIDVSGNYLPLQTEVVNFSNLAFVGVRVYGRPNIDHYKELYEVSSSTTSYGNTLTIYYPGTTFPGYASHSWLNENNSYYENFNKSERFDFDFLAIKATIGVFGQTVNYSLVGDYGIALFNFNIAASDDEIYDWNSFAVTGADQTITLPKLPAEITADFATYSYSSWRVNPLAEILQFESISNLEEYAINKANGVWLGSLNYKYAYLNLGTDLVNPDMHKVTSDFFGSGF